MPTNVTVEYTKASQRYSNAKTREEKIAALEEMISTIPGHKGCEVMKAQLKQRLAKLREKPESKASRKIINIPKEGDAQVGVLGMTQSGKSTLLSKLTNARPKISSHPFTTTRPEIGTFDYHGVKIQLIEIPSSFNPVFMSIAQNADSNILIYRSDQELEQLKNILAQFRLRNIGVSIRIDEDLDRAKDRIWNSLGLIRVFCKEPGKKPETRPMVMEEDSNVQDAACRVHKDFLKFFNFARVWGSSKYPGEKVGLEYRLKDKDILEIHMG